MVAFVVDLGHGIAAHRVNFTVQFFSQPLLVDIELFNHCDPTIVIQPL